MISSTTLAHLAAIRAEAMHKLVQYEQTMGCPCSHEPLKIFGDLPARNERLIGDEGFKNLVHFGLYFVGCT